MKNRPKLGEGDGHTMPTPAHQKVAEEEVAYEVETAGVETSIVPEDSSDEESSSSSTSRAEIYAAYVPADSETGGHKVKNVIEIPTALDILCGRGKPIQSHSGNQWMHQIVDLYRDSYLKAPRKKKPSVVKEALNTIMSSGGRFLRRIEGEVELCGWEQVTHSAVLLKKLSHALRCSLKGRQKEESSYAPATKRHSQEVAEPSWTTASRHHSAVFSSYIPPSFPHCHTTAQMHSTVLSTTSNLLFPPSNAGRMLSPSLSAAMMTPEPTSPGLSPSMAGILLAGLPRSYAAAADNIAIENLARRQILEEHILRRRRGKTHMAPAIWYYY